MALIGKFFYPSVSHFPLPEEIHRIIWDFLMEAHPFVKIMNKFLTIEEISKTNRFKLKRFMLYMNWYFHKVLLDDRKEKFFSSKYFSKKFQSFEPKFPPPWMQRELEQARKEKIKKRNALFDKIEAQRLRQGIEGLELFF